MLEPVIVCPTCRTEIKLTESLAAPIVASVKKEYEKKIAEKDSEVSGREAALREQAKEVATARAQVDAAIEEGIRRERQTIAAEEARKARLFVSDELDAKSRNLADLEQVIAAKDEKLAEAQKVQAELLRKERELDDAKREIDLTIEQRVQASLGSVREKARRDVEAELNLKVTEREETIAGMQRQIDVLKQKAEQGSQQLQGEAQELELEFLLTQKFQWIRLTQYQKANSVVTSSSECRAPPARYAEPYSGNRRGRETGVTAGCPNCEVIKEQQRPISRSLSRSRCPRRSNLLIL